MLRVATNVSWKDHIPNKELYGCLPKLTMKIRERRMRLAGHCIRHNDEEASKLVLWEPQFGSRRRGRPRVTYVDNLHDDTSLQTIGELKTAMSDRDGWKDRIHAVRAGARPK